MSLLNRTEMIFCASSCSASYSSL